MITATAHKFDDWRGLAKQFLASHVPPTDILWQAQEATQPNLFAEPSSPLPTTVPLIIAKDYLAFIKRIACHRDEERWALLYQSLWRIQNGEAQLYRLATDPLMHRLQQMDKEIQRDAHKTKAFVRFRRIERDGAEHYIAWHRPDHCVLPLVAGFFQRRFSVMTWDIMTPDESLGWDGERLQFGPGVAANTVEGDDIEALWLTYYGATFNPARVKIKAMKREMPVRHWATLPETALIPKLLAEASQRVDTMLANHEGFDGAAAFLPAERDFASLKRAASVCRGCSLHCEATQTVFGEGPQAAPIMLVGEQPGDQEDSAGRAFVGPAGQVLDNILESAGLARPALYITNAVKHFKFTRKGALRMHRSPDAKEVKACKPWLQAEIDLIKPKIIVTAGVTAARSLVHAGFSLKHDGEQQHQYQGIPLLATWHPSAVLRAPDSVTQAAIADRIKTTLTAAQALAGQT